MLHSGTVGPEPHDITEAQFSMHYSLALTVSKKSNGFDTYMEAWRSGFKDPEVLEVARKVSVVQIPDAENSGRPGAPVPKLTVKTKDGNTYVEDLSPSKGSPQNPMTYEELENKFMGLATRVMPKEQASTIAAMVRDLEKVKDLRDLTELLVYS
jgi:2-methylcitrate dehydratase PrpD